MPKKRSGRIDVMTPAQRSRCMSRIRSKNTRPEQELRKAIWASGLRYRLYGRLPGKPDIVFSPQKVAVFVDGCFWHGCHIHRTWPKTRSEFWRKKIRGNVLRDKHVNSALKAQGWLVRRFWEHEVEENPAKIAKRITRLVKKRTF